MANKKIWMGMLAMVLTLGLFLVGCDTGTSNNPGSKPAAKSVKVTGITLTGSDTNGEGSVFIYTKPQFGHGADAGLIAREIYHEPKLANGELLVDLYVCDDGFDASGERWTGSGEYYICLTFAADNGWIDEGGGILRYWWTNGGDTRVKYDIQNAVTTFEFSKFKPE